MDSRISWSGQKVLVIGAGISGIGGAKALSLRGADVTLSDLRALAPEQTAILDSMGITCVFGTQDSELVVGQSLVVISPGIPLSIPIVAAAKKAGVSVISEIEIAYQLTVAPIYAVTGTNGKTTTTTLIEHMVSAAGIHHVVGGNIGTALSEDVANLTENDVIIAEISSFQLETIEMFRPKVAVILNISPDHFERHHTMEAYVKAKARIFENQKNTDILLLNYNDQYCLNLAKNTVSQVYWINVNGVVNRGAYVETGKMWLADEKGTIELLPVDEVLIQGKHNWENALAAAFIAHQAGVPVDVIRGVLRVFTGLEHRIEFVGEYGGIRYFNDSKATNTDATIKAIDGMDSALVWIAGGHDKMTNLTDLMIAARRCVSCVFYGEAGLRFEQAAKLAGLSSVERVNSLSEAVVTAARLSKEMQASTVLFSPACSSFDAFSGYRERGRFFKECVRLLGEENDS